MPVQCWRGDACKQCSVYWRAVWGFLADKAAWLRWVSWLSMFRRGVLRLHGVGFCLAFGLCLAMRFVKLVLSVGKTLLAMNLVLLLGVLFGGFLTNKGSISVWLC
jgi:hypothetical protein